MAVCEVGVNILLERIGKKEKEAPGVWIQMPMCLIRFSWTVSWFHRWRLLIWLSIRPSALQPPPFPGCSLSSWPPFSVSAFPMYLEILVTLAPEHPCSTWPSLHPGLCFFLVNFQVLGFFIVFVWGFLFVFACVWWHIPNNAQYLFPVVLHLGCGGQPGVGRLFLGIKPGAPAYVLLHLAPWLRGPELI